MMKKIELIAATKRIAKEQGIAGRRGGWLYRDGKPCCQGWQELALRYIRQGRITEVEWKGLKRYCTIVTTAS
jgi:hypothetical protein